MNGVHTGLVRHAADVEALVAGEEGIAFCRDGGKFALLARNNGGKGRCNTSP